MPHSVVVKAKFSTKKAQRKCPQINVTLTNSTMWAIRCHKLLKPIAYVLIRNNKKPVQRARKTARYVICQYPQSTLLFGTARSSVSNLEFPTS